MRGAAIVAVVLVPALAFAEPRHDADAHARRGVALYNLGHYDAAIEEFEQAYELFQSDALLFNLGQAHRKLEHCDRALHYYAQFLAGDPAPALAAQVRTLLPKLTEACRTKDERPAGTTIETGGAAPAAPEAPAAEVAAAAPPPVVAAPHAANLHVAAAGTVGSLISSGTGVIGGARFVASGTVGPIEVGGALGVAGFGRAAPSQSANLVSIAADASYRLPVGWGRLTADAEVGAQHLSSLDRPRGLAPGLVQGSQWLPLVRAELGAERDVLPHWAVHAGAAVGFSPAVGNLESPLLEIDFVLGMVYAR